MSTRTYREANKEKIAAKKKADYEANKQAILAKRKAYYEANRDEIVQRVKLRRQQNLEAARLREREYARRNKERKSEYYKTWSRTNKSIVNTKNSGVRAAKLNRTPCWLTEADFEKIRCKYAEAQHKTETTGEQWDVDHIIPLRGKFVSGLHVPANLRVIKHVTNCSKRNHFDLEKEWR